MCFFTIKCGPSWLGNVVFVIFPIDASTNEFGAMRSDCLVQFSILAFYSKPHELIA